MGTSTGQRFWELLCSIQRIWGMLFALTSLMLLLQLFALAIGSLEEETYYILALNFVILVPLFLVSVFVLYRCGLEGFTVK